MNSDLQASMQQYIGHHRLLKHGNKVLATVSGGIDSMVMLHLLHDAGVELVVAHCNFGLRGDESDGDEDFVKNESAKLGIECVTTHFETSVYAAQNGISIQMAARELRYRWFHELSVQKGMDTIAIAHNCDDRIETLLINLARGTGIHGLSGIKPQNGKIIRPLLFASRKDIETHAKAYGIGFREDSSNATDKYARNYIRHHVLPGLEQFFPGIRQTIDRSMEHFSAVGSFYDETIEYYKNQVVTIRGDLVYVDLQGLMQSPSPPTLLYEILKPYGFSGSVAAEILEEHKHSSGRQFFSNAFRVICDRQSLVIQMMENELQNEYLIDEHTVHLDTPIQLTIDKFDKPLKFIPDTSPDVACLDGGKLKFPIVLRKWKHGDKFRPLGMRNMKKLSDFFIDAKLSLIDKERCWVMVSGGQIVWVVGQRIDDRFKITSDTTKIVSVAIG